MPARPPSRAPARACPPRAMKISSPSRPICNPPGRSSLRPLSADRTKSSAAARCRDAGPWTAPRSITTLRNDPRMVAGCVGGAETIANLKAILREAGFEQIAITPKATSAQIVNEWAPGAKLEDYVVSAYIEAVKPDNIMTSKEEKEFERALKEIESGKTTPLAQVEAELNL